MSTSLQQFKLSELNIETIKAGNKYTYIKYNDGKKLVFESPTLTMDYFGVPKIDQYHKNNDACKYIKVPLERLCPLKVTLSKMDKYISKNKVKLLGKKYSDYTYVDMVRNVEGYGYYVKVLLKLAYKTREIQTKCVTHSKKDGVSTKVDLKSVDSLREVLTWKSDFKMMINPMKVWTFIDAEGNKLCGVSVQTDYILIDGDSSKKAVVPPEFTLFF